jgi:hypothetical protein
MGRRTRAPRLDRGEPQYFVREVPSGRDDDFVGTGGTRRVGFFGAGDPADHCAAALLDDLGGQ